MRSPALLVFSSLCSLCGDSRIRWVQHIGISMRFGVGGLWFYDSRRKRLACIRTTYNYRLRFESIGVGEIMRDIGVGGWEHRFNICL